MCHSRVTIDCLLVAIGVLYLILAAIHRLNRFERESFISSFFLSSKARCNTLPDAVRFLSSRLDVTQVSDQKEKISGRRVEVLALFSNPRLRSSANNSAPWPLQLGRDIKYLLQARDPNGPEGSR